MEAELAATREAGEGVAEELEVKVAEAAARREQAATRFHEAGQQSKGIVDRCNELKAAVTKEEHRLQQLRYRHMQLVRSILSQPRNQQQQQSVSVTQDEEEEAADRLPFENAAGVLPSLKRILFGRSDSDEDDSTQDSLDEYDALELRVDEGVVGRILSESASRRGARAGAREVVAVLEDEIERLQEIVTHMKPNLRAYERNEGMTRALGEATRSLEAAKLEASEIGQHFEALKNARKGRFNECYEFVRERVMTYYRQLTSRAASHDRTGAGGETPEDPLLTPDAAHRGRPTAFTGQRRGGVLNQDAGGSVYLDAENVDEP
ncbi:Structural maintenance of chromosomes protein 1B, partial [Perkinsus olseni]